MLLRNALSYERMRQKRLKTWSYVTVFITGYDNKTYRDSTYTLLKTLPENLLDSDVLVQCTKQYGKNMREPFFAVIRRCGNLYRYKFAKDPDFSDFHTQVIVKHAYDKLFSKYHKEL